jgi:hypothetical protein
VWQQTAKVNQLIFNEFDCLEYRFVGEYNTTALQLNPHRSASFMFMEKKSRIIHFIRSGATGSTAGGIPSCFVNAPININCASLALANAFYSFDDNMLWVRDARSSRAARTKWEHRLPEVRPEPNGEQKLVISSFSSSPS